MTSEIKRFTVADPRGFDGDPYEVGERAIRQAAGVAKILQECLADAETFALNADLSRQEALGQGMSVSAFEDGPYGRRFAKLTQMAEQCVSELELLAKAAGFNPKAVR